MSARHSRRLAQWRVQRQLRKATNLEHRPLADLLQVQYLHPSLRTGDNDSPRYPWVEPDKCRRGGERDRRERAQVPRVVDLEVRVRQGQALPASVDKNASARVTLGHEMDGLPHGVADGDDAVSLGLDLADPAGVGEDCLLHDDLRAARVEERERAAQRRRNQLR